MTENPAIPGPLVPTGVGLGGPVNVPGTPTPPSDPLYQKPPDPVFPKMELPESPNVPWKGEVNKPDCEGMLDQQPDPTNSPVPPPAPGKFRIMISIPILTVTYECFESFLRFWTGLITMGDSRFEFLYQFHYRKAVHMAEEAMVNSALYNKCTHLLLIDDDIYDYTVEDFKKLFDADKDFISGVMHASRFPHAMCVFRRYDPSKKVIDMPADTSMYRLYEIPCRCHKCDHPQTHWDAKFCPECSAPQNNIIQKADLVPFPFTLMKTNIFAKIKKPWFHCTNQYPTDSWFCDRLIEAGMSPYAHMGVRLNHAGITDETKQHYMNMGMIRSQKQKAVVVLSPEQMEQHQNLLYNKMQETEKKLKAKPPVIADGKVIANKEQEPDLTVVTHGPCAVHA